MKRTSIFKPKKTSGAPKFNGRKNIEDMYKTPEWENFSKRFIEANPRCYSCGRRSEITDHIIPHKGDVSLFEKQDNFLPLCWRCHSVVTAKFDRGAVTQATVDAKIAWLQRNRILNDLTFKVKVIPYKS